MAFVYENEEFLECKNKADCMALIKPDDEKISKKWNNSNYSD